MRWKYLAIPVLAMAISGTVGAHPGLVGPDTASSIASSDSNGSASFLEQATPETTNAAVAEPSACILLGTVCFGVFTALRRRVRS